MGQPKLLLPFRRTTILGSTLDAFAASTVDQVIVVIGSEIDVFDAELEGRGVTVVGNPQPSRGNMSSMLCATESDPDAGAFVLAAGDLPTIAVAAIDALVDLWVAKQPWAAVTEYGDRIAHPFLLSRPCVDEVAGIAGSKVLWRLLVDAKDDRVRRVAPGGKAPLDVNTPADYEALNR
jgi:molybdenum cofactor cytidylyltransferase